MKLFLISPLSSYGMNWTTVPLSNSFIIKIKLFDESFKVSKILYFITIKLSSLSTFTLIVLTNVYTIFIQVIDTENIKVIKKLIKFWQGGSTCFDIVQTCKKVKFTMTSVIELFDHLQLLKLNPKACIPL